MISAVISIISSPWEREILKNESIVSQNVYFMQCDDQNTLLKIAKSHIPVKCNLDHPCVQLLLFTALSWEEEEIYLCSRNQTSWLQSDCRHPKGII